MRYILGFINLLLLIAVVPVVSTYMLLKNAGLVVSYGFNIGVKLQLVDKGDNEEDDE